MIVKDTLHFYNLLILVSSALSERETGPGSTPITSFTFFDTEKLLPQRQHKTYMQKGIEEVKRADLIGGRPIRSMEGSSKVERVRKRQERINFVGIRLSGGQP